MDICCYNRPFDDQSQMRIRLETEAKLYIQENIKNGGYSLTWSYMLDYENANNPYEDKRNAISPWKSIACHYCKSSNAIYTEGIKLMASGIDSKDALHISCAMSADCGYFITTDHKLLNKELNRIRIINPIDFVVETESLI